MINLTSNASSACPEVTFHCFALNLEGTVLRWFFNTDVFAVYTYNQDTDLNFDFENQTYNALVGGVNVTVISAIQNPNNLDAVTFLSIMTVTNISTLQKAGVRSVSCGSFTVQSNISIMLSG